MFQVLVYFYFLLQLVFVSNVQTLHTVRLELWENDEFPAGNYKLYDFYLNR